MRYGHAPGGIIGITLKPESLKVWALSLHTCSRLEEDLDEMIEKDCETVEKHKEEGKTRIANDKGDREAIRAKLEKCIDPLIPEKHPDDVILNIVTGEHGTPAVNVHDALRIGFDQMNDLSRRLPGGFHETIHKKVITMVATKKHVSVGDAKVYDTNVIYSRVIELQASGREVDIKDVISHELGPVPKSMLSSTRQEK